MAIQDNGGFDLVIEVSESLLRERVSALPLAQPQSQAINTPLLTGQLQTQVRGSDVRIVDGTAKLEFVLDLQNTKVTVQSTPLYSGPIAMWLQTIPIRGIVKITDSLEVDGVGVSLSFAPDPANAEPVINTDGLDTNAVLASPLVTLVLARAALGGQAAYEQARDQLLGFIRTTATKAIADVLSALGMVRVLPNPTLPVPATSPVATSVQSRFPGSVHVLYNASGPTGDASAITRRLLLSSSLSGRAAEALGISIANGFLLSDFVRPAVAGFFGLPLSAFSSAHPCAVLTSVPVTLMGAPLPTVVTSTVLNFLIAGVDESGLLHIAFNLTANGTAGAVTVTASVDIPLTVTLGGGAGITFGVVAGRPSVRSDIAIAWWVYFAAIVIPVVGLSTVTVLASADAVGGLLLDGPLSTTIVGAIPPFSVALPLPRPLTVSRRLFTQTDASTRTVTLGINVPDPFRSHDIIGTFV